MYGKNISNKVIKLARLVGLLTVLAIVLILPSMAAAETVVRTGNSVSVEVNQTVENDFYSAAGQITHSGTIKEDMTAVGGSVTINGAIGRDLLALGGTVQVHAPVGDDVRVVAGETVVAGAVKGDLFVMGGTLKILSSASVDGNVYFYGGQAEISGTVEGVVMGRAESFTVNSAVGGIDASAVNVELLDSARVSGDVSYSSPSELYRAPEAAIEGEIIRGATGKEADASGGIPFIFFGIWLFTSFCFFLLFRPTLERVLMTAKNETLKAGLFGLVAAVAGPLVGVVLMATILGVWLGILKILITLILFIVTLMIMPIIVGGYALSYWKRDRKMDAIGVAVGMAIIMLLSLIPVLGGIALFLGYIVTLGSILYLVYQKGRGLI